MGIHVNPQFPGVVIARRVVVDAGGFWSSASGLSAMGIACRKGKGREDEEESERAAPCVTPVEA